MANSPMRSQTRSGEQGPKRAAADVVDPSIADALARHIDQQRGVEFCAIKYPKHHRKVGALRVPRGLKVGAKLDLRRAVRPADGEFPRAAPGLGLATFSQLCQQALRGLPESERPVV